MVKPHYKLTIVVLHGNGGGAFRFERVKPYLPAQVRFCAVRLSGFAKVPLGSVGSARRATRQMLARTEQPGATFSEGIETLRWLYITLVTEMFSLTAAMGGPLSLLRRLGVLEEHSARPRLHEAPEARLNSLAQPTTHQAA
jgi:hypothetical protein